MLRFGLLKNWKCTGIFLWLTVFGAKVCLGANANLSLSAYRALGQPDLNQNGLNIVGAGSLNDPQGAAVDSAGHLYVADTLNHRVLAWESVATFQNGGPAALVLGQPNLAQVVPNGIGAKGLNSPFGVAVEPVTENLYVADTGNNRVLRFPSPFAKSGKGIPDVVYGQPDFKKRGSNAGGISGKTMSGPRALAFDALGNLWVSDTNNNRVLRFPAPLLNTVDSAADVILGQPNATSGKPNRAGVVSGSGFDAPYGLAFDAKGDMYVADFANARVLQFQAPVTSTSTAALVFGQSKFTTRFLPQAPTSSSLAGPAGLVVDAAGDLVVSVPADNRVMVFPTAATSGAPATQVLGQPDFSTNTVNTGSFPEASANSLALPGGLALDGQGDLLVADSGNNRVLFFTAHSNTATRVLGQSGFGTNAPNQIKPGSINAAYKIAIDYSENPFALYVSDSNNNRVLIWKDSAHFHSGAPADLVIGQPNLYSAVPNADGGGSLTASSTGLFSPRGVALEANGDLWVADSGNNRVLHYPRPSNQTGRITPDVVLGQSDFTSSTVSAANASSFNTPSGLAIGPNGDLFVADAGNNRVLEFANGAATGAAAVRVYGQTSFTEVSASKAVSAETLLAPQGLVVDRSGNLYVADVGANRVAIFPNTGSAPQAGLPASLVLGQPDFSHGEAGAGPSGLHAPLDVALDSGGNIFVSDAGNNRVLVFASLPNLLLSPGSRYAAYLAVGQPNLNGIAPNFDTPNGLATPEGLAVPTGILLDRQDTLYVGDTGNNRVVQFLRPATVENAATLDPAGPVGQGAWCILNGTVLVAKGAKASSTALPMTLANRELVVNDEMPAPMASISPSQVKLILPAKTPIGVQRIALKTQDTGEPIAGGPLFVAKYAPGLYTTGQQGTAQAMALNDDGTANSAKNPAKYGSNVKLFGTGQGPVAIPVKDGQPAPHSPDDTLAKPTTDGPTCLSGHSYVCVAVGGTAGAAFADVTYSGLAPGQVGTWELDITIPATGIEGNTLTVLAAIGGPNFSNKVTLAVK